jgi:integrase
MLSPYPTRACGSVPNWPRIAHEEDVGNRYRVAAFVPVARLPRRARDIRRSDVDGYVSARGASPATLQREVGTLRHALKLAIEWELLVTNPAAGVKLPKLPPGKTGFLSEQQFETAMAVAADWMRRGELLGLRWADVNFRSRQIILRVTKNGERRALHLNDSAFAVLTKLRGRAAIQRGPPACSSAWASKASVSIPSDTPMRVGWSSAGSIYSPSVSCSATNR